MKGIIAVVAAILAIILLFIGKYMFPNVDGVIESLVKDVNGTFLQVKTNSEISDARCYRDGNEKGVVLEYTLSKRLSEHKLDAVKIKKDLIADLSTQGVEEIVELGIYFVVIYKNYKDQEILKVKITADELNN